MKITPRTYISAAVLSACLMFPAVSQAVPASEAATVKPSKVIDVASIKPLFKKKSKAVIAGYQVAFVTRNKASAHAMNMGGSGTAKASMETFLGNVDYAQMQAIVDEAMAHFIAKLQAAGIEVIAPDRVLASTSFQQLEVTPGSASQPYQVGFQGADYIVVPASGLPLWFNQYDGLAANGKKSKKNTKLMAAMSKEFDAAVLAPVFAVDFAYLDAKGGAFGKKASVSAQNGMLIVPPATVFWGSTDGLTYPKFVDGFWAEGATGTFVTAEDASNRGLVKGLAGMGIDIGPVSARKAIVLEAEPDTFHKKSVELLDGAAELFSRAVKDIRD